MTSSPPGFPPIESLGFLSDGVVTALVAADASIEWMCIPRMDGPSVFGAILDRGAGHFRVGPAGGPVASSRRYLPGSLVLETTWDTGTGTLVLTDALTVDATGRPDACLVRWLRCTAGEVAIEAEYTPSPGYGRGTAEASGLTVAGLPTGTERMVAGDTRTVTFSWHGRPEPRQGQLLIESTVRYWNEWLAGGAIPTGGHRAALERSALTLKGLIHAPTGAPMAAASTSLPETPGGNRNWDYRYTWIRDGVCTLAALQDLGFTAEAHAFLGFIADRLDAAPFQVMYGIGGETELPESTLDHLGGL